MFFPTSTAKFLCFAFSFSSSSSSFSFHFDIWISCRSLLIFHSRKSKPNKNETQCFRRTISEFVFPIHLLGHFLPFPFVFNRFGTSQALRTQRMLSARCLLYVQSNSDIQMETDIAHNSVIFSCFLSQLFYRLFLIGWSSSIKTQTLRKLCSLPHKCFYFYIYSPYGVCGWWWWLNWTLMPNAEYRCENREWKEMQSDK